MRPTLGDLIAALIWLGLLTFAAWFILWTMGAEHWLW